MVNNSRNKKQTRTEKLVRRLCEMLQLDVTQRHNTIYICPKVCIGGPKADQTIEFETWRQCLFGNRLYYGLCHKTPWTNNDWEYADNHMIEASSLDELELELAIRGF